MSSISDKWLFEDSFFFNIDMWLIRLHLRIFILLSLSVSSKSYLSLFLIFHMWNFDILMTTFIKSNLGETVLFHIPIKTSGFDIIMELSSKVFLRIFSTAFQIYSLLLHSYKTCSRFSSTLLQERHRPTPSFIALNLIPVLLRPWKHLKLKSATFRGINLLLVLTRNKVSQSMWSWLSLFNQYLWEGIVGVLVKLKIL